MIGSRDPIRRLAVAGVAVLVAALMLAACRSSSDTPSPSASQSPTDVPPTSTANAGSPSPPSSPGGSASATPGATASPPPSGAIDDLAWTTSPAGLFGAADVI
ncbi:MAG TPA: hypothetical protein VH741_12790, partial [Candidatus Limnocylindrales bacterium]